MTQTTILLSSVLILVTKVVPSVSGPLDAASLQTRTHSFQNHAASINSHRRATFSNKHPASLNSHAHSRHNHAPSLHNHAPSCTAGVVRVLQSCGGPLCAPRAECVTCVPHGVDEVCKAKGFQFSILVGSTQQPRSDLTSLGCDPRALMEDTPLCPPGSVCVAGTGSRGTCCYSGGSPRAPPAPACPGSQQCGTCPPGHVCKVNSRAIGVKGHHGNHTCVGVARVKAGRCPVIPTSTPPPYCMHVVPDTWCTDDSMCPGELKCCRPTCGGQTCIKPVPEQPWSPWSRGLP